MHLTIAKRCLTQILDPGVEYDLDLCLISHVIDLNAINHVSMSRLYGNSTQQQGNGQQSKRAGEISHGSQRATGLQYYFSFFPTPQSAHPVKQPPEQSLSGREKSHPRPISLFIPGACGMALVARLRIIVFTVTDIALACNRCTRSVHFSIEESCR